MKFEPSFLQIQVWMLYRYHTTIISKEIWPFLCKQGSSFGYLFIYSDITVISESVIASTTFYEEYLPIISEGSFNWLRGNMLDWSKKSVWTKGHKITRQVPLWLSGMQSS